MSYFILFYIFGRYQYYFPVIILSQRDNIKKQRTVYVYDVLEMDYLGCPASSPLSSRSSTPTAFWEATPISSMRPQLHKSPKLLRVLHFPGHSNWLSVRLLLGLLTLCTHLERRLELLQLLCTGTGKAIYRRSHHHGGTSAK